MRIDLGELSAERLLCELPPARPDAPARRARAAAATGLVGAFATTQGGWQIAGLGCARASLDLFAWTFGKLVLEATGLAELTELRGELSSRASLELQLELGALAAPRLSVTLGALRMSAQLDARGLSLEVAEHVGVLRAQRAVFRGLEFETGALQVAIGELTVSELVLDWGGDEFSLAAGTAEVDELRVARSGTSMVARGVELAALHSRGSRLSLGQARIERLEADVALAAERATTAPAPQGDELAGPEAATPRIDLDILNGLSGRLGVNVAVDLSVPIIGRRRATHELRVGVDAGALDFRELEDGLARLEDSLIDFSVREGALVLERGLPLIATRGRGKPIVIWPLAAADHELAQRNRVRLAVLPRYQLAGRGESEPPAPDGSSSFKLRELSLLDIDGQLAMPVSPPVQHGVLRALTFRDLSASGQVHHQQDGDPRKGMVRLGCSELRAQVERLPLGALTLAARVELAAVPEAVIGFEGLRPRNARAVLESLAVADLELV